MNGQWRKLATLIPFAVKVAPALMVAALISTLKSLLTISVTPLKSLTAENPSDCSTKSASVSGRQSLPKSIGSVGDPAAHTASPNHSHKRFPWLSGTRSLSPGEPGRIKGDQGITIGPLADRLIQNHLICKQNQFEMNWIRRMRIACQQSVQNVPHRFATALGFQRTNSNYMARFSTQKRVLVCLVGDAGALICYCYYWDCWGPDYKLNYMQGCLELWDREWTDLVAVFK